MESTGANWSCLNPQRRGICVNKLRNFITGNSVGTVEDASVTGIDGGLITEAMDYAFESAGRVADPELVRA